MSVGSTTTGPDVDLLDGNFYADANVREAYHWMRTNRPVFRDRNGLAALTTYRAVLDAERDPKLFSNAGGSRPDYPAMPFMIDMDDPAHALRRKLVNQAFTRRNVHARRIAIGDTCDTLIDGVCERGECDFVHDLAAPLPMIVIGEMLGIPERDHPMLLRWSESFMTIGSLSDPEALEAAAQTFSSFTSYCTAAIERRRADPTDDLISNLVFAEIDGQRLDDSEIVMETLLLLIGGDETTRHTLSGGTAELLRHPDQWQALRSDLAQLPGAIEEMLRWSTPSKSQARVVTADAEFHGARLYRGEKLVLLFESANFDETVFGDPNRFRIDRRPNNHLAFGFGQHFCLGNQLARVELAEMMSRLVRRLPDLQVVDGAVLPMRPSSNVSGPEAMPVVFSPTQQLSSLAK